ncbi:MAG: hypothetical protein EAY75_02430 [Bacteroidetes bacterium]|nr:MAG: hypothetical protein EAY75_02430 [Bacteroidota bacterium]
MLPPRQGPINFLLPTISPHVALPLIFGGLKKLTAILLLALLCFNWGGYRLLVGLLQTQTDKQLQSRLDAHNYNQRELIELSAPVNLPYTTNWATWEAVEGQIVINGFHYNYVERLLHDGVMTYRCIANAQKQDLLQGRDAFVKLSSDFDQAPNTQKAPKAVTINNFIGDYDDCLPITITPPVACLAQMLFSPFGCNLALGHGALPTQPPQA